MTFDEVNTRIDQPMEHDIPRGIRAVGVRGGESEAPPSWLAGGQGVLPLQNFKF